MGQVLYGTFRRGIFIPSSELKLFTGFLLDTVFLLIFEQNCHRTFIRDSTFIIFRAKLHTGLLFERYVYLNTESKSNLMKVPKK